MWRVSEVQLGLGCCNLPRYGRYEYSMISKCVLRKKPMELYAQNVHNVCGFPDEEGTASLIGDVVI